METGKYEIAAEEETEDLLDFANMVFGMSAGQIDFEQLLPKAYAPQRRQRITHHVIREGSRYRAMIDIYPLNLQTQGMTLKAAYIGTVSVHPKARGKGYMITLMEEVEKALRNDDYDVIILDGNRHRYQHYGFEKAGRKYCFQVTQDSIRHSRQAWLAAQPPIIKEEWEQSLRLQPVTQEDDALLDRMYELYTTRTVTARSREDFFLCLQSWDSQSYAVLYEEACIGYLNVSADETAVHELVLTRQELLCEVIHIYMAEQQVDELTITAGSDELQLIRSLEPLSEYYHIALSHQFKPLHMQRVLQFLLQWKQNAVKLEDGHCTISIRQDQKETLYTLSVEHGSVCVLEEDAAQKADSAAPDLSMDSLDLIRTLTTGYYDVAENLLQKTPRGWFPLPFFLPEADAF